MNIEKTSAPGMTFENLWKAIANKNLKVVVLVDEYDIPLQGFLNNPEAIDAIRQTMHDFYIRLKSYGSNIRFMMMTGVTKLTKLSVFSGLNNPIDLTMMADYAGMLGYTHEEMKEYFSEQMDAFAEKKNVTLEEIFDKLLEWYDNYRFSPDSDVKVLNPVSVGKALSEFKFKSYWISTGRASMIVERLRHFGKLPSDLDHLTAFESDLDVCDAITMPLVPLLYQGGYLTIKDVDEYGEMLLGIPNTEVRQAIVYDYLSTEIDETTRVRSQQASKQATLPISKSTFTKGKNMNAIIKKVVVAICVAMGSFISAIAGEIVNLTALMRSENVDMILSSSELADSNPLNKIVDGKNQTCKLVAPRAWVEFEFPETWHASNPLYVTQINFSFGKYNYSCPKIVILKGLDAATQKWVVLGESFKTANQTSQSISILPSKVGTYRKFRIELGLVSNNSDLFEFDEIAVYGTVDDAVKPVDGGEEENPPEVTKTHLYVNETYGSDENDGSELSPLKTLAPVLSSLENNTVVHLSAGEYVLPGEMLFNNLSGVSFEGSGRDTTILKANSSRHMTLRGCENIVFRNMTLCDGRLVDDTTLVGMGCSVLAELSDKILFENCDFRENQMKLSNKDVCVWGGVLAVSNAYVTISGCVFEENYIEVKKNVKGGILGSLANSADVAAGIFCDNTIIRKNDVFSNEGIYGVVLYSTSSTTNEFNNCLIVENNSARGTGGMYGCAVLSQGHGESKYLYDRQDANMTTFVRNSTVAYNMADTFIDANRGAIWFLNNIAYGQRSLERKWQGGVLEYDSIYEGNRWIVDKELKQSISSDPITGVKFLPDYTVVSPSIAFGKGYQPGVESTFVPHTWYVNPTSAANGDGSSQSSALRSLTSALSVASDGDTIILAEGEYTEATETFPIEISDRRFLTIEGAGKDKSIFRQMNSTGPMFMVVTNCIETSIGGFSVKDFTVTDVENKPSAMIVNTGVRLTLHDIAVENCRRAPASAVDVSGGHFFAKHVQGFRMERCSFKNNTVLLANNKTLKGGVAYFGYLYGNVRDCEFVGNKGRAKTINGLSLQLNVGGDAANATTAALILQNSLVADNIVNDEAAWACGVSGDPIYSNGNGETHLSSCTLIGGANLPMYTFNGRYYAENCIFANCGYVLNVRGNSGNNVQKDAAIFYNCVFQRSEELNEDTLWIRSTVPDGTVPHLSGRIPSETNNRFVDDIGFRNVANGDYRLKADSPAVDIGDTLYWMIPGGKDDRVVDWVEVQEPVLDLAGNARISGVNVDAGCYEYRQQKGCLIIVR